MRLGNGDWLPGDVVSLDGSTIINGIPGSLYVNLVPAFKIKGASLGFSSACARAAGQHQWQNAEDERE